MNIKAVARKARVSTATVSRTINGSASVSPKTAERVRRAIDALGFHPNTNARALGSGRSSLYGLIISDITNPFFPELVKAFEDVAVAHGQEVLIANTNYDPARMETCVRRMLQRKVDGVAILTSEMNDALIEVFSRRHIPLVFLDTGTPGPGISSVRIDYPAGITAAYQHLSTLGHHDIAFLSGPLSLHSARTRLDAFDDMLRQCQRSISPHRVQVGNHRVDGGHDAMDRVFASGPPPTAVLCSNDLTAIGAMGSIYEHGLRVPEDISIIGFDDIQISAFLHPALTTLSVPRVELANTAFRSIFTSRRTASSVPGQPLQQGQHHLIHPTLMLRESTAPASR